MVNKKFLAIPKYFGRKAFFEYMRSNNKQLPLASRLPIDEIVEPAKWLDELPFTVGDRVQIISGPHKDKIGRIVDRLGYGNAFRIEGISSKLAIIPVEAQLSDTEPVFNMPDSFDYKNLRLVSTIQGADGKNEDVAIHSVSLGRRKVYDSLGNRYIKERFATHDPSIVIPWPSNQPEKVDTENPNKACFATQGEDVEARTYFPASIRDGPLPLYAVSQVTNVYSKHKRHRYAPRVTEEDLARTADPVMPQPPKTKELLRKLREMPRPDLAQFSPEVEEFLGARIKAGLEKRKVKEIENWKQYV